MKTFVILKPDAVYRNLIGEITKRFEDGGLKVVAMEMVTADEQTARTHYNVDNRDYVLTLGHADISGKSATQLEEIYKKNYNIINNLQQYLQSGPIVKMVLEGGEDAVAKVRSIVGKTDPAASPEGSIRGDLGDDSFAASDKEDRAVRNLVHASGTDEEAQAEIKLWFPELS